MEGRGPVQQGRPWGCLVTGWMFASLLGVQAYRVIQELVLGIPAPGVAREFVIPMALAFFAVTFGIGALIWGDKKSCLILLVTTLVLLSVVLTGAPFLKIWE